MPTRTSKSGGDSLHKERCGDLEVRQVVLSFSFVWASGPPPSLLSLCLLQASAASSVPGGEGATHSASGDEPSPHSQVIYFFAAPLVFLFTLVSCFCRPHVLPPCSRALLRLPPQGRGLLRRAVPALAQPSRFRLMFPKALQVQMQTRLAPCTCTTDSRGPSLPCPPYSAPTQTPC